MAKNKYLTLVLLVILLLLVRLPVVYTSMYKIYDSQELYVGTIAKELIEGPALPLFDYQLHHPTGGSLASGLLAVPFFLLFGQSYFSLKLLILVFSACTLILWYVFLARFFNKRVALLASLFFILSPPFFTKFTLMSYGKHAESNLFTAIVMFIFFRLFLDKEPASDLSGKKTYYALFGFVSGFAIYFDSIFFVTLSICSLFWFIFDRRFILKKSFLVFSFFFLLGISPWLYYNATHNFKGVCLNDREPEPSRPLRELFAANPFAQSFDSLRTLLVRHVPNSPCFENFQNVPGRFISGIYYAIFVISFCVIMWLNRKIIFKLVMGNILLRKPDVLTGPALRETFLLACPAILFLLYSVVPYSVKVIKYELYSFVGYKRLVVLYPFIFALMALFLDKLWSWRKKNVVYAFIFLLIMLFLIVSGFSANCGLITASNFANAPIYEGYSYHALGGVIAKRSDGDILKAIHLADKVRAEYRPLVFKGIGAYWGQMYYGKKPLPGCMAAINKIDVAYRPYALAGFGLLLGSECRNDILRADYAIRQIDEKDRPYVCEGLGEWIGLIYGHRADQCVEEVRKISTGYQADCYRGVGVMVGSKFGQNIAHCVSLSEKIDPEYRCYYFEGLARHLGWRYKHYLKKDPGSLIDKIPEGCRISFNKGLQEIE